MAITKQSATNVGKSTTSSTTLTGNIATGSATAGDVVMIGVVFDNTGTSTPTISSTTGGTNITWTTQLTSNSPTATSAGAVRTALIQGIVGAGGSLTTANTITITFSAAITAKCALAVVITGANTTTPVRSGTTATASGLASTASVTTGATNPVSGDCVVGFLGLENNAGVALDSDTTNGSWDNITDFTSSGGAAANVAASLGAKIVTATGAQTFNTTSSADWSASILAVQPAAAATSDAARPMAARILPLLVR